MENLSMGTKAILLRSFITTIALVNLAIVAIVYLNYQPMPPLSLTYRMNLEKHVEKYLPEKDRFESYSFYENFDTLIYNNSIFNTDYEHSLKQFSDMNQQQYYKFFDIIKQISMKKQFSQISKYGYNYNDWTRKDAPIKNQQGYNSSFIFAALTSIEYQLNKNNNGSSNWISLSVQEVVDCCPECLVSRRPESVFDYIKNYGIGEQLDYPYEMSRFDTTPKTCRRAEKQGKRYKILGYRSVKNCQALEKEISYNPLVVGLDARNFFNYEYGIFDKCERKATHYMTVVGISYNYWKLQNSWGRKWGEMGYMRIGPADTCGVCLRGSMPVLENS